MCFIGVAEDKNPWNTPLGKGKDRGRGKASPASSGSGVVTPTRAITSTDRSKQDALFADLQRLDEATGTRLLLFMTHEMIEAKFRLL